MTSGRSAHDTPAPFWRSGLFGLAALLVFVAGARPFPAGAGGLVGAAALALQTAAAGVVLFVLPGVAIVAAGGRARRLSRFLIASLVANLFFWLAAGTAIRLTASALTPLALRWTCSIATLLCLLVAARRASRPPVHNDLSGALLPAAVGAAALFVAVWVVHRPASIDDGRYLTDGAMGRLARLDLAARPQCAVVLGEGRGPRECVALPVGGLRIRVDHCGPAPQTVSLVLFVCSRLAVESDARIMRDGVVVATEPLMAAFDRSRHSRNYHKMRSNCGVVAASVTVSPGASEFRLALVPRGPVASWSADAASLSNMGPRETLAGVEALARLGDLADTRESFGLAASLIDHPFTHTVDYDERDIAGGGYASVEPLLHHHLGSLVMALCGVRMGSLAIVYLASLLALYGACCFAVRRLAGRLSWPGALAMVCVFLAYTTFVRPGVEGASPDTTFLLLFVPLLFLVVASTWAGARDRGAIGGLLLLSTLTQYYATPLFMVALCAYVLVFKRWRAAAGLGLLCVAAALAVMLLRVGVGLGTGSAAALWADLRDQNLSRYFGLAGELFVSGRWWLAPVLGWNYAHLLLAALCAGGGLTGLAFWGRRREGVFLCAAGWAIAAFVGVPGFARSHYIAPTVVLAVVGAMVGVEALAPGRRRTRLRWVSVGLAAGSLAVCLAAGRDYTGRLQPFSFWCRSGNMERSRYFLREGLNAARSGAMARAERLLDKAVFADPQPATRAVAWAILADGHVRQGDLAEADHWARRAVDSDPGCLPAQLALAEVAFRRRDLSDAEERLRRGLQLDARSVEAYTMMAQVMLALGRPEQARAAVHRALAIDPHDRDARALAARLAGPGRSE